MSAAKYTEVQVPVQAVEWVCHAATTIKDASGAVLCECSGQGRHSDESAQIAAEIVRRLNLHGLLLEALTETGGALHGVATSLREMTPKTAAKLEEIALAAMLVIKEATDLGAGAAHDAGRSLPGSDDAVTGGTST